MYRLRPLITALIVAFKRHGGMAENLSIDERMIPYYGKQHIKGKPIRFSFKNGSLCESTGYIAWFRNIRRTISK